MPNYSGVSCFAMMAPQFPFEAFLATSDFAPQPTLAALWGTFGDSTDLSTARFKQFTSRYFNKLHLIEIHPINNTAIRNNKIFEGEPFPNFTIAQLNAALERNDPATLAIVAQRIQEIRAVMEEVRNDKTYLVLTTGLEDDYTTKAFQNIYAEIIKHWPYFVIRSGSAVGNFPREAHGQNATAGGSTVFVNEDGYVSSLSQSKKFVDRNKHAMCTLLWRPAHQGRDPVTNNFPPGSPRNRTFTWTAEDVLNLGLLLGPLPGTGPTPPPVPVDKWVSLTPHVLLSTVPPGQVSYECPGAVPLPPPNPGSGLGSVCSNIIPCANGILWKPESQDSGGSREGKPVLLFTDATPGKAPLIICASNGVQIGSLGYYGTHNNKGARFYSGWAGGSGEKAAALQSEAVAASGKPEIYVRIPNNCVGPIIPTQRTGEP